MSCALRILIDVQMSGEQPYGVMCEVEFPAGHRLEGCVHSPDGISYCGGRERCHPRILPIGFSKQEYWSGLHSLLQGTTQPRD